ncbi:MAG: TRAP transporter substrate-binding protein [Castellaniella sp.]
MLRIKTLAASFVLALGSTAVCAQTVWTMATGYPDDSFLTQTAKSFIKDVEEKSEGRLKFDLRNNDTLIKHDSIKRAVQSGQIPIGDIRFGVYGNEGAMYILDSLPNIAKNYDEAELLIEAQKPYFEKLFASNGMRILVWEPWPGQGFYTKNAAENPEDFKGLKLRIYSQATLRMGELLGFNATILPFAEVSQAFATGLINSLFTSAQTGSDTQIWDNLKHFAYTGTMHNKNAIIVNERAFRKLDPDLQQILIEAGERATRAAIDFSKQANSQKMDVLREHGMTVVEASDSIQAAMEEVGQEMMAEWRKQATPDELAVLDRYLELKAQKDGK